ncbi:hypothetical protein ACWA7J_14625 [Leptothrix sp. BB-4]
MTDKIDSLKTCLAVVALVAITSLAACGGGSGNGSGSTSATPPASPEGVYGGTRTATGATASTVRLLLLEDGQLWGLYGGNGSTGFTMQGFLHAKGSYKDGAYSATDLIDYGVAGPAAQALTATYDTNAWTWSGQYGGVSVKGAELSATLIDYHKAAKLADVAGTWTLDSYNNAGAPAEALTLSVSTAGVITGSMAGGCPFSGKLTPRASGKNLFDATLTFDTADLCAFKGQTINGMALSHLLEGNSGKRQLLLAGYAAAAPTIGMGAYGVRSVATLP